MAAASPQLIIDSVLMSALLGPSSDGSDTNGLPPPIVKSPPPSPLLLALVVLSKQSFSPDCHRWSPGPRSWPPMGGWVGPVVIRAISPRVLLGMPLPSQTLDQCGPMWTNVDQCGLMWTTASGQYWSSQVTMHTPFPQPSQKEFQDDDDIGSFFTLWQQR